MAEEDEKRMRERRMDTDMSEEEKTGEVWEKTDKVTTSSENLPTFAGEIKVNEKWEGRGANVIGDKQSGGYSWTKGGTSAEEISRKMRRE